ncbi:hypothetical protein LP419_17900 [Massilia sp. H-1]|nr:hypothetical protein LP419_17900 [Massilia sp. H-1]
MHVVYLKNAEAAKLAATLRAVVSSDSSALPQTQSGTSGGSVQSGQQGGGKDGGLGSGQQGADQQSEKFGNANSGGGGGGAGWIQADTSTNTLIITAPDAVYRNLRNVIDMLDAPRPGVHRIADRRSQCRQCRPVRRAVGLSLTGDSASKYRTGVIQNFTTAGGASLAWPGHGGRAQSRLRPVDRRVPPD